MFEIVARGIPSVEKKLKVSGELIKEKGYDGMNDVTNKIVATARRICPFDSGELMRSIHKTLKVKFGIVEGKIIANKEYAAAVETMKERHPTAQAHAKGRQIPYLYPAVEKHLGEVEVAVKRYIDL